MRNSNDRSKEKVRNSEPLYRARKHINDFKASELPDFQCCGWKKSGFPMITAKEKSGIPNPSIGCVDTWTPDWRGRVRISAASEGKKSGFPLCWRGKKSGFPMLRRRKSQDFRWLFYGKKSGIPNPSIGGVHIFSGIAQYISDCYTHIVAVGKLSANMNRIIGTFKLITISKFKKEIESHVSSSFSFSRVNRWRTHMMQWICSKNSLLRWGVSPNY